MLGQGEVGAPEVILTIDNGKLGVKLVVSMDIAVTIGAMERYSFQVSPPFKQFRDQLVHCQHWWCMTQPMTQTENLWLFEATFIEELSVAEEIYC